jgi:hypothetical protein
VPAASLERLAQALNVPGSAIPAPPRSELGQASALGKTAALAGLGALGVIAALAAAHWLAPAAAEPRAPLASPAVAVATTAFEAAPAVPLQAFTARPDVAPSVASPTLAALAPDHQLQPKVAQPKGAPPHGAPRASAAGDLRAELRALEAVQSALRAGRAAAAEQALDDYFQRFPRGELALEAELSRVDLALARGDRELARARARELLARPDGARYRARLAALGMERDSSSHRPAEVTR